MSYIGNAPISAAFLTDTFSGNGSTVAFTMTVAPANTSSIIVAITGVLQDPSTYSVSGTTLTFSAAPPSGTSNISVRYLGIPASGVTTTAYRTVTNFTATAGQTSFTIPSYTVGYVDVYRNGVRLVSTDYTATTGTTVVLNNAATVGDTITTISFYVSTVLNALPQTGGTLTGNLVITGTETVPTITSPSATALTLQSAGTTGISIDTSQRVTTPYQTAFFVKPTAAYSFSTNTVMSWGSITYNQGSSFASNVFTAPVNGVYQFSLTIGYYPNNATNSFACYIRRNGTNIMGNESNNAIVSNWSTTYANGVYSLNAGDTIDVLMTGTNIQTIDSGPWTYFSGFLVG